MPPKKQTIKKEKQLDEKSVVTDAVSYGSIATTSRISQAGKFVPIHRRAVFSRTAIEPFGAPVEYLPSKKEPMERVVETVPAITRHDTRSVGDCATQYTLGTHAETPPMSHRVIMPRGQKEDWLRIAFYILFAIAALYWVYIIIGYTFARTTLTYQSSGESSVSRGADESEISAVSAGPRVQILKTSTGFLRVRRGPSTGYDEIVKTYPGDVVRLLEARGEWYQIELNDGRTGWIFAEYAKMLSN